ncbi:hypothetical protein DFA_00302 [Cavenderia fasciculata]|uniref:Uncharacterized protein n=1 Tax=Cavenderia fasciculata TaxID=261658 RepID=F4PY64_CACFS|nr:uncharacterized protein DFA_00302 [Cavenderia fasciculata]EGG19724.1 hypothetical protein DFA_00302 [Cavenderia fasciculata]|eukprot:XP_004358018.1 hypothetical protein DFA_00302 [Cavenderia fasciculata]
MNFEAVGIIYIHISAMSIMMSPMVSLVDCYQQTIGSITTKAETENRNVSEMEQGYLDYIAERQSKAEKICSKDIYEYLKKLQEKLYPQEVSELSQGIREREQLIYELEMEFLTTRMDFTNSLFKFKSDPFAYDTKMSKLKNGRVSLPNTTQKYTKIYGQVQENNGLLDLLVQKGATLRSQLQALADYGNWKKEQVEIDNQAQQLKKAQQEQEEKIRLEFQERLDALNQEKKKKVLPNTPGGGKKAAARPKNPKVHNPKGKQPKPVKPTNQAQQPPLPPVDIDNDHNMNGANDNNQQDQDV